MNAEDFVRKETEKMAASLGAGEYQSKCAGSDALHEYKQSAVIKGGSEIDRKACQACR